MFKPGDKVKVIREVFGWSLDVGKEHKIFFIGIHPYISFRNVDDGKGIYVTSYLQDGCIVKVETKRKLPEWF